MKHLFVIVFTLLSTTTLFAQEPTAGHDSFKQDEQLKAALIKMDMTPFVDQPVSFICDTMERVVKAPDLNLLMKTTISIPKNSEVKKASETNNGYVQSYGIYNADDALMYVRFTLNSLTGKLEEVVVEKN